MYEWVRYCINPACHRAITQCNGGVIARDMLAYHAGERTVRQIREICGLCVLRFELVKEKEGERVFRERFEELLRENSHPWSPV